MEHNAKSEGRCEEKLLSSQVDHIKTFRPNHQNY
jgi:hypothetical protein